MSTAVEFQGRHRNQSCITTYRLVIALLILIHAQTARGGGTVFQQRVQYWNYTASQI